MMATWHGYIGIEDIALTQVQRGLVIDALKGLNGVSPRGPQHILHCRIRPDGKAVIFEAQFDRDNLTPERIGKFLATAVGVAESVIQYTLSNTARGPVVTFAANSLNKLRMIAFGGIGATWDESRTQALAYLAANAALWEKNV